MAKSVPRERQREVYDIKLGRFIPAKREVLKCGWLMKPRKDRKNTVVPVSC